ncbi:MAG: 16S rRNA (cytosine(1402)-N(4))-methyltransferase RsmH [Clostridia bacterium]|nr:16S rRNA (cytosine(1402)-N(4))-methyltransferase RsmH [Clostridia bacterium]
MDFKHYSVMREQCIEALNVRPDGIYVDMTLGGGGHSSMIAERLTTGKLIGIDRDADAIQAAGQRLAPFAENVITVKDNYKNIKNILSGMQIDQVDGILCDLGVSSYQLDEPERGFSYRFDAPLDMRMDREQLLTAADVINTYSAEQLAEVIFKYGEERYARKIAYKIVSARSQKRIENTLELSELIASVFPPKERYGEKHPAKRTFQALRIEVNEELKDLDRAFEDAISVLKPGGRIAVMTFHSLEDRIVKNLFRRLSQGCICDKNIPVCICNNREIIRLINRKPILADEKELDENNRSKPAKLRIGEKI